MFGVLEYLGFKWQILNIKSAKKMLKLISVLKEKMIHGFEILESEDTLALFICTSSIYQTKLLVLNAIKK